MRYRMLDVRIWCDEKFRSLTPLKPSGQALFLYLLTNPHTTSIPGLYRAGGSAMAEELGWSLVGFNRALKEVVTQNLVKADLKARVIFIANAIKYNKPQSPNVVRSWAIHWDEIPECSLKTEAYYSLHSFVQGLGKAFAQAFSEAIGQHYRQDSELALLKPCVNQEQNQEQKKEQENNEAQEFPLAIPLLTGNFYQISFKDYEIWKTTYSDINVLQELRKLITWNNENPTKRKQSDTILRHIHTWFEKSQQKKQHNHGQHSLFPVTFEHNLKVAKKWLTPVGEFDQCGEFPVLTGKKIYEQH